MVGSNQNGDPAAVHRVIDSVTRLNTQINICKYTTRGKSRLWCFKSWRFDAAVAVQAVLGLVEPQSLLAVVLWCITMPKPKKSLWPWNRTSRSQWILFNSPNDPNSPAPVPSARRSGRSCRVWCVYSNKHNKNMASSPAFCWSDWFGG